MPSTGISMPLPSAPYRGIEAFRFIDQSIYAARDEEIRKLIRLITIYRGILFYGDSGVGKSSLLNAGVIPALLKEGFRPERLRVQPIAGKELLLERISITDEGKPPFMPSSFAEPISDSEMERARVVWSLEAFADRIEELRETESCNGRTNFSGSLVLIFDQFEEIVTLIDEAPPNRERFNQARAVREQIVARLLALAGDENLPLKMIFSFREDYLAKILRFLAATPQLCDQAFRLAPLTEAVLPTIIRRPFDNPSIPPGHFNRRLSELTCAALESAFKKLSDTGSINLTEVQIACLSLWEDAAAENRFVEEKDHRDAVRRLFGNYLDRALDHLGQKLRTPAIAALTRLVTTSGTRNIVSEDDILSDLTREENVPESDARAALEALAGTTRLVFRQTRGDTAFYEITSEFLIPWIREKRQAREAEAQAREAEARAAAAAARASELHRLVIAVSAALAFAVLAAIIGFVQYGRAVTAKRHAQEATKLATDALKEEKKAKSAADRLIRFMQYDLHDTLGKLGHLEMMRTISTQIMKYYEDYPPEAGDVGALRERAVALMEQGNLFRAQGNLASALKSYRDSLAIREKLAEKDPTNAGWQRDLSDSYERVGDVQRTQGDLAGARTSYRDSLAIHEKLAKKDPTNTDRQRDLSASYERVGDVQRSQGDLAGVVTSYRDSLAIREKLTKRDPTNADWQHDLSNIYERVGDVQSAQGDLAGARTSYGESLAIREKLTKQDPTNADWQHDLSNIYERVGDMQKAQGDLAGARTNHGGSLAIRENLVKQDPTNTSWQRDLSNSYERVGDLHSAQGDLADALKSYRDSLTIREDLAKKDSTNADWQHDLSLSYERVGNVQKAEGDLADALKSYLDSFAIRQKLANQDPTNADWQRDLSLSYESVGDVQSAQGDLAGALRSYRESLSIREKLIKKDPTSAVWQVDIAFSYWRTGTALARADQQSEKEARSMVEKGRDILRQLKEQKGLSAQQQGWLDAIEADLQKMQENK